MARDRIPDRVDFAVPDWHRAGRGWRKGGGKQVRVLVVEDEASLGRLMGLELTHAGFAADVVASGLQALETVQANPYDCLLVDVMLPDISGIEVCRRVRRSSDVAVIMVTARGQIPDKVAALDMGADDYLVKPVNFEELGARIRAVVRRRAGSPVTGRAVTVSDVTLYRDQHRVEVSGRSVEFTPMEFQLLEFLLIHRDWVQTRQRLLDDVWGFDYAGDSNIVEVTVSRLRRRLAEAGSALAIETVRGVGYVVRTGS